MTQEGIDLIEAVKMVSLNSAKALGIDQDVGTIEVGKCADLICVAMHQGYPMLRKTLVSGNIVYQADYLVLNSAKVDNVC